MTHHTMYRYTIVAPLLTNAGEPSGYPDALCDALLANDIDGWTEYSTVGSWRGKREQGVLFEIYRVADTFTCDAQLIQLARLARQSMPDQEAVQVTMDHYPITLTEG